MRLSCPAKIEVSAESGEDDQETITMLSRQEQPVLYTELDPRQERVHVRFSCVLDRTVRRWKIGC